MDRTRRRQGRVEYRQPNGSWSTKPPRGGAIVKAPSSAVTKPSAKPSAKPTAGGRPALPPGTRGGRSPGNRGGRAALALLGIPTSPATTALSAAFSNFGLEGESPDRKARLLGYKDAADQRKKIAEQKVREGPGRPTSRFAGARDAAHARAKQIQGSPVVGPAAAPARPSRSPSGTSTPASSQRPAASPAKPKQETKAAAQSYRDPEDVKGTSVGRYRTLSEHRAAVQANKALKISSQADTKSDVYTPSTKVDGSKLDASKATSKAEEYDKNKRKKIR